MLLPVLLISKMVLIHVAIRGYAVGGLRYVFVRLLVLMLDLLGLLVVAEEAKGPVGEVEAAEDDECCESLCDEGVSETAVIVIVD
jgi:hypothetical protein